MQRFFAAFVVLLALLIAAAAKADTYTPPLTGDMVKLKVFQDPPALPEIMLSSTGGGLKYFSDFRGKIVILNMWATWCPPCIEELPSLNALQLAMGSNEFAVVAVSLDQSGPETVKKYMDDNNLKELVPYIDVNQDLPKLEVLKDVPGIPVTFILDPGLHVLAMFEGDADWNGRAARAVIEYYQNKIFSELPMSRLGSY